MEAPALRLHGRRASTEAPPFAYATLLVLCLLGATLLTAWAAPGGAAQPDDDDDDRGKGNGKDKQKTDEPQPDTGEDPDAEAADGPDDGPADEPADDAEDDGFEEPVTEAEAGTDGAELEREPFDLDEARAAAETVEERASAQVRSWSPREGLLGALPSFAQGEPPFRYTGTLPAGQGPLILIAGGMFVMGISTTWSMISGRRLRRKAAAAARRGEHPPALDAMVSGGPAPGGLGVGPASSGSAVAGAAAGAKGRGWRGRRHRAGPATSGATGAAGAAAAPHGRVTARWREAVLTEFEARKMRAPVFADGEGGSQVTLQGCAACSRHEPRGEGCAYEERILLRAIKARGLDARAIDATADPTASGSGNGNGSASDDGAAGTYVVWQGADGHGAASTLHAATRPETMRGASS